MCDSMHKRERVEMAIWIIIYISTLGDDKAGIEGQGMIKKVALSFAIKFCWLLVQYILCQTTAKNILNQDRASLTVNMMTGYDINFAAIIWHELHKIAFGETMTLPFPCLVQRLYDKDSMPDVLGLDYRVAMIVMEHTKTMKYLAHQDLLKKHRLPTIVPPNLFEGLS